MQQVTVAQEKGNEPGSAGIFELESCLCGGAFLRAPETSGLTRAVPVRTRETVDGLTPAIRAKSLTLTLPAIDRHPSNLFLTQKRNDKRNKKNFRPPRIGPKMLRKTPFFEW